MANNRDDFTENTKRILQGRVGNRCSNPNCRCLTSGPNFHEEKVTTIGIAAHITAASENGPRYNPLLDSKERQHISNGIWLCATCATLIDKDEKSYPIELLQKWKIDAEAACRHELEGIEQSNIEEAKEGWLCGHCHTFVEKGQTICTGCFAEVIYSATDSEINETIRVACTRGFGFSFILFILIPEIFNNLFKINISYGWGMGVYALILTAIFVLVAVKYSAFLLRKKYHNSPPRFVRNRNL